MEMICAIVYQLTKDLTPEEIEKSGFGTYYVDHTLALWPQAASGAPWTATYFQSKGDPITDLHEDMAAEQKARTTYDNILRLVKDPEICEPIRFLREREIVHYQRFGEVFVSSRRNWTVKTFMLSILNLIHVRIADADNTIYSKYEIAASCSQEAAIVIKAFQFPFLLSE